MTIETPSFCKRERKLGDLITGADVMQGYRVRAFEIGEACYEGKLHAFTDAGLWVLEETKLAHIPKYPPVGVDPLDHIQYTHNPKWDWTEQLKKDGPQDIEPSVYGPHPEYPEPRFYFSSDQSHPEWFDGSLSAWLGRKGIPTWLDQEKINPEAIGFARNTKQGLYGKELKGSIGNPEAAALQYMESSYNYYSEEELPEIRTFCFRIKDYAAWLNNDPNYALSLLVNDRERFRANALYNKPLATVDEVFSQYEDHIKKLLFQRSEVDAWLHIHSSTVASTASPPLPAVSATSAQPPDQGKEQAASDAPNTPDLLPVNVRPSLFVGKTPQTAYDALKAEGLADDLIAYVLNEKCDGTKTDKGRPFLPDGSDDSVYRRKLKALVIQATSRYSITFNE